MSEYEVLSFHSISTCYRISKGWAMTENYYTNSGDSKTLHMTVVVLVFQFMKLHLFHVFLMREAHSEDIPCWTKPHGTSRVLGTAVPSVVQQNSNNYQDVIQTTHSGRPVAEFLQKKLHLSFCKYCSNYFTVKKQCSLLS